MRTTLAARFERHEMNEVCTCGAPAVIRKEFPHWVEYRLSAVHTWYMTVNGEVEEWGYTHEEEE